MFLFIAMSYQEAIVKLLLSPFLQCAFTLLLENYYLTLVVPVVSIEET